MSVTMLIAFAQYKHCGSIAKKKTSRTEKKIP